MQLVVYTAGHNNCTFQCVLFDVQLYRCRAEIAKLSADKADVKSWNHSDLQQLKFVTACINETLRLFNVAVGAPRLAALSTELGGYSIPQGAIVISDIYCLHHNEACA